MCLFCFPMLIFRTSSGFEASSFERIHGTAVGQPGWEDGHLRGAIFFQNRNEGNCLQLLYIHSLYLHMYICIYTHILMKSVLKVERRDSYPAMSEWQTFWKVCVCVCVFGCNVSKAQVRGVRGRALCSSHFFLEGGQNIVILVGRCFFGWFEVSAWEVLISTYGIVQLRHDNLKGNNFHHFPADFEFES